jgi:hypothetical protein
MISWVGGVWSAIRDFLNVVGLEYWFLPSVNEEEPAKEN